ncbi:MAG TPA: transposase [Ktedonobacterales bacterium]|nr:transposase [Ktedonobacterales bacterium]
MSEYSGRKSYKYKLQPTPQQEELLDATLWRCRTLYNCALEQRKTWWQRGEGKSATYYQQKAELPDLKAGCPEFAEVNAQVLQDVIQRIDKAFQAFFRRVKAGDKPGYPRFQGRDRYHSFTYPQYGGGAVVDGGVLNLSKIGRIPLRLHRPLEGTPKTVTISHEADGWYAIISCADVPMQPLPLTGRETGIDVGLKVFLVTAQGLIVENPRHFRKSERRIAKADKHVARCQKGSHGRRNALARRAKAYQHVKRQRADFHHKVALQLVRDNDTISLEDLQVANMVRNRHLAKSISDAAWGQFRAILEYKAACAGKRVIAIPAHYTSQDCSGCGERAPKSLSIRTHVCPSCGLMIDRDENAAINILRAGQARQALT